MHKLFKIIEQSGWQVLGKVVTSISTFIILGLVTRNYGKEGTGIFTLTLTYQAIFYLLADFGLNAHVLRKIGVSEYQNIRIEWQKLLGARIMWSLVLVVLAVGLLPFWPFANLEFSQSVLFGTLAILGSSIFITCNLIFQAKLRYDLSVLATTIGTIISLGFYIIFVKYKLPIQYLLLAHLTGWMFIGLSALFLTKKLNFLKLPIFNIKYALNLFKASWPIAATLSLNVLYFRADSFLISYFKSSADVGIYNVSYIVFQSVLVLPTFIMNAYYPSMLKSLGLVKQIAAGLIGISLVGTLITFILSPLIIEALTGGGFDGSIKSLQILSLGFPAYFLSSLLMWVLVAKGDYKKMLVLYTSGLALNLVLNFLYIPKFSYIAASFTTVISEYAILLMQVVVLWSGKKGKV